MLQHLSEDGYLTWTCHGCKKLCTVHHSHEEVQVHHVQGTEPHHRSVALPRCDCGSRASLKVDFTDEELAAPNMLVRGVPTESHAMAHRQMRLVAMLEASGKPVHDTIGEPPAPAHLLSEAEHDAIVAALQAAGLQVDSLKALAARLQKL